MPGQQLIPGQQPMHGQQPVPGPTFNTRINPFSQQYGVGLNHHNTFQVPENPVPSFGQSLSS